MVFVACGRLVEAPEPPSSSESAEVLPPTTRLFRLTTLQWELTVRDLLHLDGPTGLSEAFIGDPLTEGFDNDGAALEVGAERWQDLQAAAEVLATRVRGDPDLYGAVVPQDPRSDGGFVPWIEEIEVAETLWSRGEVAATFEVPEAGYWRLRARVSGDALPEASLGVDGLDLLVAEVGVEPEVIEVETKLSAGLHTVHVGFAGDDPETGIDRDLHVDWIGVQGEVFDLGASTAGPAEARAWVAAFGKRAYRRPLTADEEAAWLDLFDRAPELVGSGDDFADGVELVISGMLQSPWFLYRIEDSTLQDSRGRVPLSSWEVASKLSYALWNTMPDEALLQAAEQDALQTAEQVQAQARRMLEDERASAMVLDLYRQVLRLDAYANIDKDPALFPEFTPDTPEALRAETEAFVGDVVGTGGGIRDLYTAPHAGGERSGLLMLPGFLALEADARVHNPIRRGVFVAREALCAELPPPPGDVPPLPPSDELITTRQLVEAHTGTGTCGGACHELINPLGFAFEHFDALGRYRTHENGVPVDATGTWTFESGERAFDGAAELSIAVGDSIEAHRCTLQHWLEYLHGRGVEPEDRAVLDALARTSLDSDRAMLDLAVDLVVTDSFRYRAPEPPR